MRAGGSHKPIFIRGYEMKPKLSAFRNQLSRITFDQFYRPMAVAKEQYPELKSEGNKPLTLTFDEQVDVLIYFHLQAFESGRHLIQALEEDELAKELVGPENGLKRSTFFEAINSRGLNQLFHVYNNLYEQAKEMIPDQYPSLGDIVGIDGSLITATMSMDWADYRKGAKKAKIHLGFDINRGIPSKFHLTDGKADERPFVSKIVQPGQTCVVDRYYQKHEDFDAWQSSESHFVCRIKAGTRVKVIEEYETPSDSIVFFDAKVLLGSQSINQTEEPVRLVKYTVEGADYLVATDRFDLKAEDIARIYKLRWDIEKFFAWWKGQLNVYHLIARTEYGMMVQIISGLITYLLLAIYCHEQHGERVSIRRVRELRSDIINEALLDEPPQKRRKSGRKRKKKKRKR